MRRLVLGLLALCSCSDPLQSPADGTKVAVAHRVQRQAAYQLRREKQLIPCGTGSGMMGPIEMLALSFQYFNALSIEEGRKLAVDAINTFLEVINSDEMIRPYLSSNPFSVKNIEVCIFFYQKKFEDVPLGYLSTISAINGRVTYLVAISDKPPFMRELFTETYEEALEHLRQSNKPESSTVTPDMGPQEQAI